MHCNVFLRSRYRSMTWSSCLSSRFWFHSKLEFAYRRHCFFSVQSTIQFEIKCLIFTLDSISVVSCVAYLLLWIKCILGVRYHFLVAFCHLWLTIQWCIVKKSCVRCVCDEVQIIVGRTGHKAEGYWHKAATISVAKYLNDAITCGNRTLLLSSQQNRYVVNSDNLQLHLVNAELSFCVAPHLTKQLLCTPQLITNSLPTVQG